MVALISAISLGMSIALEKCAILVGWGQFQEIPGIIIAFIILFIRKEANVGIQFMSISVPTVL